MDSLVHAENSVKKHGGRIEDYLPIHKKLDISKSYVPNSLHRIFTHHYLYINEAVLPIFGDYITNSDGKNISVKKICEEHILEDYDNKFIPVPLDFAQAVIVQNWMNNGEGDAPASTKQNNTINDKLNLIEKHKINLPTSGKITDKTNLHPPFEVNDFPRSPFDVNDYPGVIPSRIQYNQPKIID